MRGKPSVIVETVTTCAYELGHTVVEVAGVRKAYNARGFGPAVLDQSSDSYAAVRGRKQQLINYYRDQGISANHINGIGTANPRRRIYLDAAEGAFGP